jgi:hypothetical protein
MSMKDKSEKYRLHGWDDEKIYFWDGEKERCVSDEEELYNQMLEICIKYFAGRKENAEDLNNVY